jgi:hypothetical protein
MIIDALLLLSDAQALTATAYSTNTIDLGAVTPKREVGIGEPLALAITVDVAADVANADETYAFAFVQSANANLSSDDDLAYLAIARATLVAGYKFALAIPAGLITKQYIGAQYTLGGTTPSITVTASIIQIGRASCRERV